MAFTHLHLHTDYSLLDGLGKINEYVDKAKNLGMTALAITDHGTGAGLPNFYNACKKKGIKPILGCEVYIAPSNRKLQAEEDNEKYYHLILLVKNDIGYKNLCILISRSNTEGYYYKPRIDFDLLKEYHEGLICMSACIAGEISKKILKGDIDGAEEAVLRYQNLFKDDYYLEIQNHGLLEEKIAYSEIIRIANKMGIPLVCTNDCHYVNAEDREAHEWLLCMQTKKTINDTDRMIYDGDYSMRSEEEMRSLYPDLPEAFDNTIEIVNKCNFDFEFGKYRMPRVDIPKEYNKDYFKYMEHLVWEGFEDRYPKGHPKREEAKERIEYELSVINQMGFSEYFLDIRHTIVEEAHKLGIMTGPGRGSGAGSAVCYCLHITDIEPLKYGLLFERFLNPERVSMPDIDTDFNPARKDDIIHAEAEHSGYDHFSKIQTFTTMAAKGVIRDCVRVGGYPVSIGDKLAKMIPNDPKITLKEAYELNHDLKNEIECNTGYKKLWDIALKIEGTKKAASTHACGHISVPVPCEELYPVSVDKKTGYLVCQYDMTEAEHLGNLKKDLLMLKNLTIIDNAMSEIKRIRNIDIPLWQDDILNDKKALKLFWKGDTSGIFQFESEGITKFMQELKPDCFEDVIAGVSLYRPGPMDFIPDYIKGKRNPSEIKYLTPEVIPILKPTYGVIVYQEQVMQIVQTLAGFTMGRADVVRKAMGKKKMDIMLEEKKNFIYGNKELGIPGCVNNGISVTIAETIYEQMIDFAKYAFNKSHAAAYAAISMQTAYLKAHYRLEFTAGLLSSAMDKTNKLAKHIIECKNAGLKILSPDINKSFSSFSIEKKDIRYGLVALKGVGKKIVEDIVSERDNGRYESLSDLISRVPQIDKGVLESLIMSGSLDSLGYTRNALLLNYEKVLLAKKKDSKAMISGQISLFDIEPSYQDEDFDKDIPELELSTILSMEKKSMGLYFSGHPLERNAIKLKKATVTSDMFELSENEDDTTSDDENSLKSDDLKDEQPVKYGGLITEVKIIYTKKTNEPMAMIKVEDLTGAVRCVVFPKAYAKYKNIIKEDMQVFITGHASIKEDERSIIAEDIKDLDNMPVEVWFKFSDMDEYNNGKDRIEGILKQFPGNDAIVYYIKNTKSFKIEYDVIDWTTAKGEIEKLRYKTGVKCG